MITFVILKLICHTCLLSSTDVYKQKIFLSSNHFELNNGSYTWDMSQDIVNVNWQRQKPQFLTAVVNSALLRDKKNWQKMIVEEITQIYDMKVRNVDITIYAL